jgi:hypothetical protein
MATLVKLRRTAIALLLGSFAAWVLAGAWLHLSYFSNLPKAPELAAELPNRVVVNHGSVRYGSARDVRILTVVDDLFPIAAVCFVVAVAWGLKRGDFSIRKGVTP